MIERNRYFILPYPNVNSAIWDIVVESPSTLRTNLQGNKCIVKLYLGDEMQHGILNGAEELTHSEAVERMRTIEWEKEEI